MTPENLKPKFGNVQMNPLSPNQILRILENGYFMTHQEQAEAAQYIRQLQQENLTLLGKTEPVGKIPTLAEMKKLLNGEPIELAKPEQEPIAHLWECIGRWSAYLATNGKQGNLAPPTWLVDAVKAATVQPEQEPVAWRNAAIRLGEDLCSVGPNGYYEMTAKQWLDWALSVVNTAPLRKEWVGLTGTEINHIFAANVGYPERMCLAIEAKLKEKNGG